MAIQSEAIQLWQPRLNFFMHLFLELYNLSFIFLKNDYEVRNIWLLFVASRVATKGFLYLHIQNTISSDTLNYVKL